MLQGEVHLDEPIGRCRHCVHLYVPGHVLVYLHMPERSGNDISWWGRGDWAPWVTGSGSDGSCTCVRVFVGRQMALAGFCPSAVCAQPGDGAGAVCFWLLFVVGCDCAVL